MKKILAFLLLAVLCLPMANAANHLNNQGVLVDNTTGALVLALYGFTTGTPHTNNHGYLIDDTGALVVTGISSGGGVWGSITGTLSSQTDLQTSLNALAPKPSSSYVLFPFITNSTTGSVTTNQTRCTNSVNNQATITATHIAFEITTLQAATHAGVAIYSADGSTKIADSGAQDSSTANVKTATVSAFTLNFGTEYRTCMSADGATPPTFRTANSSNILINNATTAAIGTAANAGAAGVMPATTGAITGSATANVALVLVY